MLRYLAEELQMYHLLFPPSKIKVAVDSSGGVWEWRKGKLCACITFLRKRNLKYKTSKDFQWLLSNPRTELLNALDFLVSIPESVLVRLLTLVPEANAIVLITF